MNIKRNIKYFCEILCSPACWSRNYKTNYQWDSTLNYILDSNPTITDFTGSSIKLSGIPIWVKNYPYGFGYVYEPNKEIELSLPTRRTCIRLKKFLDNYIQENKLNDFSLKNLNKIFKG